MFEVGFTELILICGLALIVLGPERLPRLAQQIGRWVGRARAMARQLREQLDQEVNSPASDLKGGATVADDIDEYGGRHENRSHNDPSAADGDPGTEPAPAPQAQPPDAPPAAGEPVSAAAPLAEDAAPRERSGT